LKAKTGPSGLALPASVDRDATTADFELGNVGILPDDLCAEDSLIKMRSALSIGCPDGVFELFNVHGG
jgi:hypothetical protein